MNDQPIIADEVVSRLDWTKYCAWSPDIPALSRKACELIGPNLRYSHYPANKAGARHTSIYAILPLISAGLIPRPLGCRWLEASGFRKRS